MEEMGLEIVRLAEFSWHKMEPAEGRYEFDWLDRALGTLSRHGLKAILGTPSAAPPAWLVAAHPDILPVDSTLTVRGFGGRHHDCQSNPVYREHVFRIVQAMAERFGPDLRVVGWQVDNELGNSHEDLCHCEHCRRGFQSWLERRYGSVQRLNEAWGTVFWSQTYDSFEQIPTPKVTPNAHNPSMLLDWRRFRSDLVVDFARRQVDIIRPRSPSQLITHNFMGFFDLVDYFDLAAQFDFASHDQYPTGFWETPPGRSPAELAATLDLVASLKGKPFWVMEQQAGPTGWQILARTPKPGQLALWAAQSIAHGADTVVFFRWRTCTIGTEQYWHGILPHDGKPGRRYQELASLVAALKPVMPRFEGSLGRAEVAILHSYEQNWAIEIQPHHPELDYLKTSLDYYRAFHERNIPVAYIPATADFQAFKLIIAPIMFLDLPGVAARLKAFVAAGGHLVLSPRSGVKTHDNVCQVETVLPGPYAELLGIEILDYDCLRGAEVEVQSNGVGGRGRLWWDVVTAKEAVPLLPASGLEHPGESALTMNRYGTGFAWYVATFPDESLMREMTALWSSHAGVASLGDTEGGIELARRSTPEEEFLFALNHESEARVCELEKGWVPLVGGHELGPFSFSLFRRASKKEE